MSATPSFLRRLPRAARTLRALTRSHSTHSVDPSEVSHFTALAAEWWDPHGSSRLLHLMNPLRLQFLRSCLRSSSTPEKDLRVLDVGCGGGILAESLARLPSTTHVTGLDPTAGVLEVAKSHMRQDPALQGKLEYQNTTVDEFRDPTGEGFDVVTTMEVVEHVPNPRMFLKECMSHVKPGGWLVGSTIAKTWVSYLTTIFVAEDVLGIVPKGTHDWQKYVNAEDIQGWARQEGWGDVKISGCAYVPGCGWREISGGEKVGNYFFGIRKPALTEDVKP